jgi:probable phosphomutase (TIGR03848 family)
VTLLLLIRHALTDTTGKRLSGQAAGIHLSDRGRDQAEALAQRLRPLPIQAVYSSPLERCVETAEAVGAAHGLPVRPVDGLLEVEYGRWTGRPLAQLARTSLWKRIQQTPSSVRFPAGETLEEVQTRAVSAMSELAGHHPRSLVAVVTHAEVIRLAVAHFAGVHIDLFQRMIVHPASVSAVAVGDGMPRILRLNDTGTMEDLLPRRRTRPRSDGSKRPLR